jgi:lysophospholipase L1-like esterase
MPRILCYGDSNTWGYATVPRPDGRYSDTERWPGVMAAELGPAWTVLEEGLNGRTTVHPDPVEGLWLDGSSTFTAILRSHMPLDVVAIMLGTNDLKARFSAGPYDIASGVGVLLKQLKQAEAGRNAGVPKALVVCPPPILPSNGEFTFFGEMLAGGHAKSLRLAPFYAQVAVEQGAALLDAGRIIQSSPYDGIHLDPDMQAKLGKAVARAVVGLAIAS